MSTLYARVCHFQSRVRDLFDASMPTLTPADKAFIVSQYYLGKSAAQIQRKFKRDKHKKVSFNTNQLLAEASANAVRERMQHEAQGA